MPKRTAPEFSYNPKTQYYRKRIKNPGSEKWVSVYARTKPELREKISDQQAAWEAERCAKDNPFVWQYAKQWFDINMTSVGPRGKQTVSSCINNYICPVIGHLTLADVTQDDVLLVLSKMAGRSADLQSKVLHTMRRIFTAAVTSRRMPVDPTQGIKTGGPPPKKRIPLTAQQQEVLLQAVRGHQAETFVMLGLYAGLRREEILGLQWDCVDLDSAAPHITVKRAWRCEKNSKSEVTELLKSDAASRAIPIPSQLVDHLHRVKAKSKADYVIHNSEGLPLSYSGFTNLWGIITARSVRDVTHTVDGKAVTTHLQLGDKVPKHDVIISIDFKVTPHQLRHTYITHLILAGVPIKKVQYLAGHATIAITLNIYTHLMDNKPEDLIGDIQAAFCNPICDPKDSKNAK